MRGLYSFANGFDDDGRQIGAKTFQIGFNAPYVAFDAPHVGF